MLERRCLQRFRSPWSEAAAEESDTVSFPFKESWSLGLNSSEIAGDELRARGEGVVGGLGISAEVVPQWSPGNLLSTFDKS